MASLSIRKIDDDTVERIRTRAAAHGVSMEEEVRRILKNAVAPPERMGDFLAENLRAFAEGEPPFELPEREREGHHPLEFPE